MSKELGVLLIYMFNKKHNMDNKYRIINKNKNGVLVKIPTFGLKFITWTEFNSLFEICKNNDMFCYLKQNIIDEADTLNMEEFNAYIAELNTAVITFCKQSIKCNLDSLRAAVNTIAKKYGLSVSDTLKLVSSAILSKYNTSHKRLLNTYNLLS